MKHFCPNDPKHAQFHTFAHVMQEWLVDADGDYIETSDEELQISAWPDDGNIWNCATCGAEATTTPPREEQEKAPRRGRSR